MIYEILSAEGEIANSPFIVPVAGCAMIAAIVIAGNWSSARKRQIESEERLAAIARGISPPPTSAELALTRSRPVSNVSRRYQNIRLTGIILVGGALGLIVFFLALTAIIGQHEILSGAACGLIPLGLGLAFLVDARKQKQELDAESAPQPNDLVR